MHYFARFKCHMNTDRNHYKANFINIAKKTMFLRQKKSKTSFPKRIEWKDIADVWWPLICLSRSLQYTFHWFCMRIEMIKIFCFKWFSTAIFCIRLSCWCIRKGYLLDLWNFPKVMEVWNRNVYIDLNGKRQNSETKQVRSHVFSYVFLTSTASCVCINSGICYDTLGSIATFKLA